MTDLTSRLDRAEKALAAIREDENATINIRLLAMHGLGEFTFSPTMPTPSDDEYGFMDRVRAEIRTSNAERSRRIVESN